jgi:hypothetical protein
MTDMAVGSTIPAVLMPSGKESSISTERALNQMKALIEEFWETLGDYTGDGLYDRIQASLDDIELMKSCISR